jgi:hypothetical protein
MLGDLVLLVPDRNTEAAFEAILGRHQSLRISPVSFRLLVHPEKDPGCRLHGHELLRIHQHDYRFALMVFDHEGSGGETKAQEELARECEERLDRSGWKGRNAVLVLEPELEAWVWSDSPAVDAALGWGDRKPRLREWLADRDYRLDARAKPIRPKEALEDALREVRKARSSSIYTMLGENVSLDRCVDPAFLRLREVLRAWFAP